MKILLLVGSGGFLGSVFRYLAGYLVSAKNSPVFPWGTFSVNLIGSFIMGALIAMSLKSLINSDWRFFLATGFCGGFTTFSAFSYESIQLMNAGRPGLAGIYIISSVLFGLLAAYAGFLLMK